MAFKLKGSRSLRHAIDAPDNGFNLVRLLCALLVTAYHAFHLDAPALAALSAAGLGGSAPLVHGGPEPSWFGLALIMAAAALWLGSARYEGMQHLRRHDYAFGIYIYHWPVLLMVRAAWAPMDALHLLGISMLVILPVAMLSWHLVEAPTQQLARRLLKRPQ